MKQEEDFYQQLAKSIQAWLQVETEVYLIYATIMDGANPHLISVTFHQIESVESQLSLIDACFALIFSKESSHWKDWRSLLNKTRKLNSKRNKIVHQPIVITHSGGNISIEIHPSYFNALALAKGQTTYNGPVLDPKYKSSMAKIKNDHKIDILKLYKFEKEFEVHAESLRNYNKDISEDLRATLTNTKNS